MAKVELTDAHIRSLSVKARTEITDTKEAGLMLRVFPSGKRTFAFRMRGSGEKIQNAVIGSYPDVKLAEARAAASRLRQRVKKGEDVTAVAEKRAAVMAVEAQAEIPTLADILKEFQEEMSAKRKIWQRTKTGCLSEAERRIQTVFGAHLSRQINTLSMDELSQSMMKYSPMSGKDKANGQVSRARAYAMPVFDWCSHRKRFAKVGLGRAVKLEVADLQMTSDPSTDDYDITGKRGRALDHFELSRVLPLLVWPAPKCLRMKLSVKKDYRPMALRFLLLTCARRSELVNMIWQDFHEHVGHWYKPYVKTISGPPRDQTLPLSDAAIALLRGLPNYKTRLPEDLVFPNADGGDLGNWSRITLAVQRESSTRDWHRHDLRRTGSTIMKILGVSPGVIDEILAHCASSEATGTSKSLANYLVAGHLLEHVEDPQKAALNKLAEALEYIESNGKPHRVGGLHDEMADGAF